MSLHALDPFCNWLAATSVSQGIQGVDWIIPAVQTVHILCVASVISSVLMIDLRLLGVGSRAQTLQSVTARFLPFIWWPLPLLLLTGATLIIAEPARSLENPVFVAKMALLAGAVTVTLICSVPLDRSAAFWELTAARRRGARCLAWLSLPLWIAVIVAGRWIAYVQVR
jgi:hypothetical protein